MMDQEKLKQTMANLLAQAGFSTEILDIAACAGNGNNRTYKVVAHDGTFAVKQYFRQQGDTRDRLHAEFAFLSYAHAIVPHQVPRPYAKDEETATALYEFIAGKPCTTNDLTENDVQEAAGFFCALNQAAIKSSALHLPQAAEACFSVKDHLNLVQQRIDKLKQIQGNSKEDITAVRFIARLEHCWHVLSHDIEKKANACGIDVHDVLSHEMRCISPSDFGFHNVLKDKNGGLWFIDFEYAGWDDPAKMVADFFSQLAVPVSASYFENFIQTAMLPFPRPHFLSKRSLLLRPVYQIKWCCIALNIFLPLGLARRQFSGHGHNVSDLKRTQLVKAEMVLRDVEKIVFTDC